jgi:rhodanese-related sulfurtransferase
MTANKKKTSDMLRIVLVSIIFFSFFFPAFGNENTDNALPDLKNIVVAGPYCGIYSLAACLDAFSKIYSLEELLHPDYIGSFRGSTNEELVKAAEKYGLHGKCYANMLWQQLQNVKEPMILHFRGNSNSEFNHWVAFLGMEGNHVRILDVPHEIANLTIAELLAQWDGVAIQLSENPIQDELIWQSRSDYIFVVLLILGSCLLYKRYFQTDNKMTLSRLTHREYQRRFFIQSVLLLGTCGFIAITYHALSPIGFLKNPTAVAEVTRRYYAVDIPEISLSEMRKISEQKNAVIYDARYHRDFERGAIPGAINLPIDSDLTERKKILQGIDKTRKIILYCQSSGCGFSDEVASFLKFNGYYNVSIFRGGYREWSDSQKQR